MQTTIKNLIFSVASTALMLALAFALAFSNAGKAEATSSTYLIDTTGNGCGNGCSELYAYLNTLNANNNASSTTNTNNSNSTGGTTSTSSTPTSTGGTTSVPYGSYVQNPYQIYSYWQKATSTTPTTSTTPYVQNPYQIYNTYQPSYGYSSGSTNTAGSTSYNPGYYPQPVYVTYGSSKSASAQINQYKQTSPYGYNSSYGANYGAGTSSGNGSGFVITSIIK